MAGRARRIAEGRQRLASYLRSLGGEIVTGHARRIARAAAAARRCCATSRRASSWFAGDKAPGGYRRRLERFARSRRLQDGLGAEAPVPWRAQSARAPARFTWAARSTRSRPASAPHGKDRPRRAVRPARAADDLRSVAGAGGQPRPVGVLPRAQRMDRRYDRPIENQIERFAPGFRD